MDFGRDIKHLRPKHGMVILAYCCHEADPYYAGDGKITPYGSHCEDMGHVEDGLHIVEWRDGYTDRESWEMPPYYVPGGWFRDDMPANPIVWWPLPDTKQAAKHAVKLIAEAQSRRLTPTTETDVPASNPEAFDGEGD